MALVLFIFFTCINGQRNNFFDPRDIDPFNKYPGSPWPQKPFNNEIRDTYQRQMPREFNNRLHESQGFPLPVFQNFENSNNQLTDLKRMRNKAADARGLGTYGKRLLEDTRAVIGDQYAFLRGGELNPYKQKKRPSPGMDMYWEEEEIRTPKPTVKGPSPSQEKLVQLAVSRLRNFNKLGKETSVDRISSPVTDLPIEIPAPQVMRLAAKPTKPTKKPSIYPTTDDFGSPVRWVPINSKFTIDGLARVTDINTGRNRQYIVNGTIFVPVIDYSLERLGLTTTTFRPKPIKKILRTDESALKIVAKSADLNNIDSRDWLAIEAALGRPNTSEEYCDADGCPARCSRLGCESKCVGDTCSSGCIGASCSTFCKGPGCLAMCIGEDCSARCEGMACEARCLGTECEAGCRSFSCKYLINGDFKEGGTTWSEHYPQYDTAPIRQENPYY